MRGIIDSPGFLEALLGKAASICGLSPGGNTQEGLVTQLNRIFQTTLFPERLEPLELPECSLEDLALLHEQRVSGAHAKQRGVFYTPSAIAAHITSTALGAWHARMASSPPRVLDPACGGGIFLLHAERELRALYPSEDPCRLAMRLHGMDINAEAVEVSRILLLLRLLERRVPQTALPDLSGNFCVGNTLLEDTAACVDCIVGNPPYGLSRDAQIAAEENRLLKIKFADWLSGKPNKYMLFLARAFTLLSEGGSAAFIVPNSWLGIRDGRQLRSRLLAARALHSIEVLHFDAFDLPSVETVIVHIENGQAHERIRIVHAGCIEELGQGRRDEIAVETCLSTPGLTIPLAASRGIEMLLARAGSALCPPLRPSLCPLASFAEYAVPLIALQVYATGRGTPPQTPDDVRGHVFHADAPAGPSWLPYLEGRNVGRYACSEAAQYLNFGPWVSEYHPVERYEGPRILLREILAPEPHVLSGAFVEHRCMYNRSILHIIRGPQGTR